MQSRWGAWESLAAVKTPSRRLPRKHLGQQPRESRCLASAGAPGPVLLLCHLPGVASASCCEVAGAGTVCLSGPGDAGAAPASSPSGPDAGGIAAMWPLYTWLYPAFWSLGRVFGQMALPHGAVLLIRGSRDLGQGWPAAPLVNTAPGTQVRTASGAAFQPWRRVEQLGLCPASSSGSLVLQRWSAEACPQRGEAGRGQRSVGVLGGMGGTFG